MPWMDIKIHRKDDPKPLWPDINRDECLHTKDPIRVGILEDGMTSGAPSIALAVTIPAGSKTQTVVIETSGRLICAVAQMLKGQFPEFFQ